MRKKVFSLYIQKGCILILLSNLSFCADLKVEEKLSSFKEFYHFFFPIQEFHPCDPLYNYYENKKHYIDKDLLTDEGNIDYLKIIESQTKLYKSPCDPLNKKSND
jgi:hypothetical protein